MFLLCLPHPLLSKHMVLSLHACLQCVDNGGTKGTANVTDLRRRTDERALGKEEEDYFNEDRYIYYIYIFFHEYCRRFYTNSTQSLDFW